MNSLEKHLENEEQKAFFEDKVIHQQKQIYYLQRRLRSKNILYNSRQKIVLATSNQTADKHVLKLQNQHNYTVQTIIE